MQIDISPSDIARLTRHAQAAGFADVESYVRHFVAALAETDDADKLLPPLSEDELANSLAMLDQGMEELAAGSGQSLEESRRLAHEKLRALL